MTFMFLEVRGEATIMRRYVLTGAPGAGKTTIAATLRARGWPVVPEAATDVITAAQARGITEPWTAPDFVDTVVRLQRSRQEARHGGPPTQVYDRSPLCTLALARFLGRRPGDALLREVDRVVNAGIYQRQVFLVAPLGFVTPTAARRISLPDSLVFGRIHEEVYREYGFDRVPVPAGPVEARAALVEAHLRAGRGPRSPYLT